MSLTTSYAAAEPARADIDAAAGPLLLEFGTAWCGHCRAAQPAIAQALAGHAGVRHLKVADGPGQPLGRSYNVKLWPTLIFLQAGREASRLVRPRDAAPISAALRQIDPGASA